MLRKNTHALRRHIPKGEREGRGRLFVLKLNESDSAFFPTYFPRPDCTTASALLLLIDTETKNKQGKANTVTERV
jgi:hypothetical protein